jgi:hypothetical protein
MYKFYSCTPLGFWIFSDGISRDVYTTYFIDIGDLIRNWSKWFSGSEIESVIDELQLESTFLKIQRMITVDAGTDCALGKVT